MDSPAALEHLAEDALPLSLPRGATRPAVAPAWRKTVSATALVTAHALPLTLFATGTQKRDWILAAALYLPMVFAVGAGLLRSFAPHASKTSRIFQFLLGLLACCFFGDPIGFAGKHRIHHRFSDTERDVHAPRQGFWQCFYGSLVEDGLTEADLLKAAPDLARVPELRLLHRYFYVPGLLLMGAIYAWGGYTMLVAGYLLPWVLVALTGPSMVNFFCHQATPRNFPTSDRSSNNRFVAWYLLGEGWHNNHHCFPRSARAGLFEGEIDPLYRMLQGLARIGLVWDLRVPPPAALAARLPKD